MKLIKRFYSASVSRLHVQYKLHQVGNSMERQRHTCLASLLSKRNGVNMVTIPKVPILHIFCIQRIINSLVFFDTSQTSTCHCLPMALTTRPSMGLLHAPQIGTPILSWQGKQKSSPFSSLASAVNSFLWAQKHKNTLKSICKTSRNIIFSVDRFLHSTVGWSGKTDPQLLQLKWSG